VRKSVVASNVGGLSENIDTFVDGLKVEPEPGSACMGINPILDDPSQALLLETGRKKVERIIFVGTNRKKNDRNLCPCGRMNIAYFVD